MGVGQKCAADPLCGLGPSQTATSLHLGFLPAGGVLPEFYWAKLPRARGKASPAYLGDELGCDKGKSLSGRGGPATAPGSGRDSLGWTTPERPTQQAAFPAFLGPPTSGAGDQGRPGSTLAPREP